MRKIFSFIMSLALAITGAWADESKVITTESSAVEAGSRLTVEQLHSLFNTGKRFAFVNTNASARGWNTFGGDRTQSLLAEQLYTVTKGSAEGYWYVKNYAGQFLTQAASSVTFAPKGPGFDWQIPQEGGSSMYDGEYQFRFQNTQGQNYRVEYKDFGSFAGDWAHYVAYGPFYVVSVKAKCGDKFLGTYPGVICTEGTLNLTAPDIEGYYAVTPSQQLEITADKTVTIEYAAYNSGNPSDVNLTPWPTSMRVFDSKYTLPDIFGINLEGIATAELKEAVLAEANKFISNIKETTDKIGKLSDEEAAIMLTENSALGDEAYNLNITEAGIGIEAKTAAGFYYALLSIQKMMPAHVLAGLKATEAVDYAIPCVQIQDDPRFEFRSFMLDCSRHFFEVEELKRMLDIMAIYKMNTFHWHLTDDQGWRAEIKKYPKLTTVGATAPDCRITDFENGTYWIGKPYGPYFYTQDEMREIVAYAAERHIEVIPEIEMLGHSVAAMVAYPEFSCNPSANRQVWTNGGVSTDIVNVANPAAVQFYKDIVDELCEIFPGRYFHIGGDECPTTAWEKNADCQNFLQEHGFSNYRQIQSWFTNLISGYIASKGKRTIVWNESITAGGSDLDLVKEHNPIIMCWMPAQGGASKAASIGLDAIITEYHGSTSAASGAGGYYINRKLSNHPSELDGAGAGDDTVEGCYKYVPVQGGQTNVIGVQATFWCEWVGVPEYLEYLALPRLQAVAEAGWTPENRKDWNSFVDRMLIDTKILDYGNYTYSQHWMPGYVPPKIETCAIIADGLTEYTFENQSKDRPVSLADDNGTLNGQASECTPFVLEPANADTTAFYIRSTVSGKYLYASASTSGTAVTLSTKKSAWTFDWETMPKYVAICLADNPTVALNNNINNTTHLRLYGHAASNGASFYTMTLTKEADPTGITITTTAIPTLSQSYDIMGYRAASGIRSIKIINGKKVLK